MATIFQARPRTTSVPKVQPADAPSVAGALAALDAAARTVAELTAAYPEERQRAAALLAFHARRLNDDLAAVD